MKVVKLWIKHLRDFRIIRFSILEFKMWLAHLIGLKNLWEGNNLYKTKLFKNQTVTKKIRRVKIAKIWIDWLRRRGVRSSRITHKLKAKLEVSQALAFENNRNLNIIIIMLNLINYIRATREIDQIFQIMMDIMIRMRSIVRNVK